MSRRRQSVRRPIAEDPKFNSVLVTRLVNTVMGGGKKNTAQRIVYGAFDSIATNNNQANPLEVLQRAVDNAKTPHRDEALDVALHTVLAGAT